MCRHPLRLLRRQPVPYLEKLRPCWIVRGSMPAPTGSSPRLDLLRGPGRDVPRQCATFAVRTRGEWRSLELFVRGGNTLGRWQSRPFDFQDDFRGQTLSTCRGRTGQPRLLLTGALLLCFILTTQRAQAEHYGYTIPRAERSDLGLSYSVHIAGPDLCLLTHL